MPAQRYSFAGSNTLETQIRNGAPADIFASAAPLNTQRLFRQGLVDKPVTFTSNRLALIVPKSNPADIQIRVRPQAQAGEARRRGAAVPVGAYTRTVLRKMGLSSVLSKVVSQETDVRAVTGKVALGQADAGFVYVTDARAVARSGDGDPDPGLGAAARALRDRCRVELDEEGGCTGVDQDAPLGEGTGSAEGVRLPPASGRVVGDALFRTTLVLATSVVLLFLLLPIVAVFLRVPPGELVSALGSDAARDALRVTAETISISMLAILVFGTPAAYWISTRRGALRDALVTLVELPLVLPPAVAGIGLLVAFGRAGTPRRDVRRARDRHRVHEGRRRPRGDVRREPVLPPDGDRRRSRSSTRRCRRLRGRSAPGPAASSCA